MILWNHTLNSNAFINSKLQMSVIFYFMLLYDSLHSSFRMFFPIFLLSCYISLFFSFLALYFSLPFLHSSLCFFLIASNCILVLLLDRMSFKQNHNKDTHFEVQFSSISVKVIYFYWSECVSFLFYSMPFYWNYICDVIFNFILTSKKAEETLMWTLETV